MLKTPPPPLSAQRNMPHIISRKRTINSSELKTIMSLHMFYFINSAPRREVFTVQGSAYDCLSHFFLTSNLLQQFIVL